MVVHDAATRHAAGAATQAVIMIPGIAPDGSLFPVEKMEAHRKAMFHVAISAFVFDGDALLIQQRALTKYHCGGLWANTCCTHPNWGESVEAAAARRVREELGFTIALTQTTTVEYSADVGNGLWEHERVAMFVGRADRTNLKIEPNPDEVAQTRWVTQAALRAEIEQTPELFTPWFRIYMTRDSKPLGW